MRRLLLLAAGLAGMTCAPAAAQAGTIVFTHGYPEEECGGSCEDTGGESYGGSSWIETVRDDGRNRRRLPCRSARRYYDCSDTAPRSTPSGRLIGFSTFEHLLVVTRGGRLVSRRSVDPLSFAWAPDGKRVVLVDVVRSGLLGVYVHDFRTGDSRLISEDDATVVDWSSRNRLAWDGRRGVVTATPTGGDQRVVASRGAGPRFAPDGRRIGYACRRVVCSVGSRGRRRRVLTRRCNLWDVDLYSEAGLAWAPDGGGVACASNAGNLVVVRFSPRSVRKVVPHVSPLHLDWRR